MNRTLLAVLVACVAAATPPDTPRDVFDVIVNLERETIPGEEKLAETVKSELLRACPQNPGRDRSFYTMKTSKGIPLSRWGWWLQIRRAVPTKTGWRALVWVSPQVMVTENRRVYSVSNCHIEGYAFENGKLTLTGDMPDPLTDPSEGFYGAMFGGSRP